MNQDGQVTQLTFFRYTILNNLRDELSFTMTRQRATTFLFLYLIIPAFGLAAGAGIGMQAHSILKTIIGSIIGLVIGGGMAWQIPRSLWKMLGFFVGKGWFLQTKFSQSVPAITSDEFIARSLALRRSGGWQFFYLVLFVPGLFVCAQICSYLDRAKPQVWIQILAGLGIFVYFTGYFVWNKWRWNQLVEKHGMACLACGREITSTAGLSGIPYMGLCRHCGTKIIEIKVK
jgi:DNA-directed RNA polymerase subunit RPC12/RpoP